MEAKEKARELVEKFKKEIPDYLYKGEALDMAAKACAIISVLEVINEIEEMGRNCSEDFEKNKTFWQSVLEELKK